MHNNININTTTEEKITFKKVFRATTKAIAVALMFGMIAVLSLAAIAGTYSMIYNCFIL